MHCGMLCVMSERNLLILFAWIYGLKWLNSGERTAFNMTSGYIAMQSAYISDNYGANFVSAVSLQNLASVPVPIYRFPPAQ
jgi:hypothetical protein